MTKVFNVDGKKVKRSDTFVDLSIALTNKIDLGKSEGEKVFGFICLRCRRLRCGKETRHGFLQCAVCGFRPAW